MRLSQQEVAAFFATTKVFISGNPRLRDPQQDGHAAAVAHFAAGGGRAMEQIPVGCGKSGLITLLPFGVADGRVLVIAPNLTIRDQLVAAFDSTNPVNTGSGSPEPSERPGGRGTPEMAPVAR
jgi:DNA repair protein RadD